MRLHSSHQTRAAVVADYEEVMQLMRGNNVRVKVPVRGKER